MPEHITLIDNTKAFRAKLNQRLAIDPTNQSLIKKVILAKLYANNEQNKASA